MLLIAWQCLLPNDQRTSSGMGWVLLICANPVWFLNHQGIDLICFTWENRQAGSEKLIKQLKPVDQIKQLFKYFFLNFSQSSSISRCKLWDILFSILVWIRVRFSTSASWRVPWLSRSPISCTSIWRCSHPRAMDIRWNPPRRPTSEKHLERQK